MVNCIWSAAGEIHNIIMMKYNETFRISWVFMKSYVDVGLLHIYDPYISYIGKDKLKRIW